MLSSDFEIQHNKINSPCPADPDDVAADRDEFAILLAAFAAACVPAILASVGMSSSALPWI